jgi:archaeosortase A (PGF-CTERM-specific)
VSALTDALAWVVVGAFLLAAGLGVADRRASARRVGAAGWAAFGVFWLALVPTFAVEMRSPIEGALSLVAVPACLYAGLLLYRGRTSLLVLTRAVAFMGLLYLPVETVPVVRRLLIETVAAQSFAIMDALGTGATLEVGPTYGYDNRFVFRSSAGVYSTYVVTACTGIGSIAIFGGLVAAVEAPLRRKLRAFALAVGIIWVLNLGRNAFIATAYGQQWFRQDALVGAVTAAVGGDAGYVSYFVADRVIAQSLSVLALVGITMLVVRRVPELLSVLEEAAYVLTRRDLDLADLLGVDPAGTAGGEVGGDGD